MLDGASTVEALVTAAAQSGMNALAITDTDGLYGVVPFTRICREHGIRPIYGVELTEPFRGPDTDSKLFFDGRTNRRATILARDEAGYIAICRVVTARHLQRDFDWELAVATLPDSVFVLSSDEGLLRRRAADRRLLAATRIELRHFGGPASIDNRRRLLALAEKLRLRAVATNGVRFRDASDHPVHRILCALRMNATIGTVPSHAVMPPAAGLVTAAEMFDRYRTCPEPVIESARVARECGMNLDLGQRRLPKFPVPGNSDAYRYLRGLALQGLSERYEGSAATSARDVLERELTVIRSMQLADYFLICQDIVRFARSRGYPCLGRGSAANSIVSYCLYITHVDPIAHNLFFERFLNDQRTSLPDFDLDFGTEDREKVLDYIFSFYGRDRVAMIGTHVTFQVRSAFREVAVAQGLTKGEVDDFIKRLPHVASAENLAAKLATSPETRSLPLDVEPFASLYRVAERISGFPRHIGTHPCGLVITPEPLDQFMPLELGEKGLAVTQWTMNPVEEAGLLKIDILGQRGLEVISYTVKAIRHQGKPIPSDPRIFLTDSQTREWLRNGRSIGCFYIESPAMIGLIRQARCDDFECLTALSSIIRPGVSNYGGKNTYLKRHLKLEPDIVLHPALTPILQDTRGCLIYQEQVIRIASELAGLSLGEADDLRRLMSFKKNRKRLSDYRDRFFAGCREKGIPETVIDEIYRQVDSFAGYAFCKAHSASFALESFESMYYKAHYPAEFMAAVLSGGGGYYGSLEYLEEARRLGLAIHPPCINGSEFRFTGREGHLRVGLMQVKGLRESIARTIVIVRNKNGPFPDLPDLLQRVPEIKVDEARNLARCGPDLFPANGSPIGQVPAGDRVDAVKAIDAAADAFPHWSSQTAYQRSQFMYTAHSLMMEDLERLAAVMTEEQGKPIQAARNEVKYGADFLLWYAEEAKRIYGQTIPSARADQRFIVLRQPVGVVGAITPWNYPISMITRKVAPALAAGCTIVLKPAEATPLCARAVFEIFEKAGIPAGVVNLVTALEPGPIGEAFLDDPRVRKLTFTGSTPVGKMLARGAASQMKRVSLELGGHAPFIVCRDADPIHAAKGLALVKFLNTGQACISPNRIFVHADIVEPFIGELSKRVSALKAGSGFDPGVRIGPLVNDAA